MTDEAQGLETATGQNVPLSDELGVSSEYDIIPALKPFEPELVKATSNHDIAECKRIFKEAGVEWDSTWDPIDVA